MPIAILLNGLCHNVTDRGALSGKILHAVQFLIDPMVVPDADAAGAGVAGEPLGAGSADSARTEDMICSCSSIAGEPATMDFLEVFLNDLTAIIIQDFGF